MYPNLGLNSLHSFPLRRQIEHSVYLDCSPFTGCTVTCSVSLQCGVASQKEIECSKLWTHLLHGVIILETFKKQFNPSFKIRFVVYTIVSRPSDIVAQTPF